MQNRLSFGNKEVVIPHSQLNKRIAPRQDVPSPKFTRKRIDVPNFLTKKSQKRVEQHDSMTYISPKKYLQCQTVGNDSFKSTKITNNFNKQKTQKQIASTTCQSEKQAISISHSVPNLRQVQKTKFQSAQQIIARVRANNQPNESKLGSVINQKQPNELLTLKIKALKQQNSYLYKKIQDFNEVIKQKNQIINQFSLLLKQKDQNITGYQSELFYLRKKNEELESIMCLVNKSYDENQKCQCMQMIDQTSDGEKSCIQKQVQKYKTHIQQLIQKVKYSELQSSMYQKLRYDLNGQIQRNQTLKIQNKKLIRRIQHLTQQLKVNKVNPEKIYGERVTHMNCNSEYRASRKQLQISFQLSPEK